MTDRTRNIQTTAAVPWSLFDPPVCVGDRIQSLTGSGAGVVVRIGRGYAHHRCPDHADYPDCVCGDEGAVDAMQPYPVVSYSSGERCISPEDRGKRWKPIAQAEGRD